MTRMEMKKLKGKAAFVAANDEATLQEKIRKPNRLRDIILADKVYLIVVALLAVAMLLCWNSVWRKCAEYERGSTKVLMTKLVDALEKNYGGEITYKRKKATENGLEYNVFRGGELFAGATLNEKDEKGILGFSLYKISEIKGVKSISYLAIDEVEIDGPAVGRIEQDGTISNEVIDAISSANFKVSGSKAVLPGLESLAAHKTNTTCKVPEYAEYVVDEMFFVPELGSEDRLVLETPKGKLIAHKMPEKRQAQLKIWTKDFLEKYTNYVVYGKGFDDIKGSIFYTSPIYNTVYKFQTLWDYYYNYELEMHEFAFSDFVQYTDDIVSLRVKYSYTQTLDGKFKQEMRPDINIYLYNNNGVWQVIEMEISEWTK